jgi:large subunit ribosomal protein L24
MHVKKNDIVEVISGKHKGKRGKILEVMTKSQRVRIEGVNTVKRHTKPNQKTPQGGIIEKFGTIHVSNVLPVDPKDDKPTRVGYKVLENGRKVRVSKRTGEVLDK